MSNSIIPVNQEVSAPTPAQPSSADPSVAGAIAAGNSSKTMKSTFGGTMSALQDDAPEVYAAMMKGLGVKIINEMRDRQERLKKLMREGYQN